MKFSTLVFPYESVVNAFKSVGIDAEYDEKTPEKDFSRKIAAWNRLSVADRKRVAAHLGSLQEKDIAEFCDQLHGKMTRCIERIIVIPLHGNETEHSTVSDAVRFLAGFTSPAQPGRIYKYEIIIRYSNTDKITAEFKDRDEAIAFLKKYE